MKTLGFALVALIALIVTVAPSVYAAREFCVVRNNTGQIGITDGNAVMDSGAPIYGWYKDNLLCASSADAAERMAGTGKNAPMISGQYTFFHPEPQVVPKNEPGPFFDEALP
jgi:hypothetical protein